MKEETTNAKFEIKAVYGELCGFRNDRVIWMTAKRFGGAYCFSQGDESRGIIARFKVKQKEQVEVIL